MAELEQRLQALRAEVAFPPTPDLAVQVQARIASGRPIPGAWWQGWLSSPRLAYALVLLVAIVTTLAVWPEARQAVADRLGLRGVSIRQDASMDPSPQPGAALGAALDLGERLADVEAARATLEQLTVGGRPAAWIAGAPHFVLSVDTNGRTREETLRIAGNVLIWERDGLTLRLEGVSSREEALAIAASVR
jgi:hypothetical protein